jgi:beta-phosphoglucomutase-like phosphatase (HAD superfamily)
MISAVIFDAEGVVPDTGAAWDRAQEVFLTRRGIAYERGRLKARFAGRSIMDRDDSGSSRISDGRGA